MAFPFEHLDVYKRSLDFVESVESLTSDLKGKASYSLIDQLTRAALSIPLNIAEGNGRWHKGEKRQFFWSARGSVFECVPIIQVLHLYRFAPTGKDHSNPNCRDIGTTKSSI